MKDAVIVVNMSHFMVVTLMPSTLIAKSLSNILHLSHCVSEVEGLLDIIQQRKV